MSKPNPFLANQYPEFAGIPVEQRDIQDSQVESVDFRRNVLTIPDIHGNAEALMQTLSAANLVTPSVNGQTRRPYPLLTGVSKNFTIVQTGDIFDRKPSVLQCLDHVKALKQQGMDFRYIAGNHEIDALYAFSSISFQNDDNEFWDLIAKIVNTLNQADNEWEKTAKFAKIKEAHENNQNSSQAQCDAMHFVNWSFDGGEKLFREFYERNLTQGKTDLRTMMEAGAHVFFEGEYADVIKSMSAIEQIDDLAYLHAGIDKKSAEMIEKAGGIDEFNDLFRYQIQTRNLTPFAIGAYKNLFWQRQKNGTLSPEAIKLFKKLGINAVIRGHDVQPFGTQTVDIVDGITIINGDIGAGRFSNPGGVMVNAAGDIMAFNYGDFDNKTVIARLPSVQGIRDNVAKNINAVA